MPTFKKLLVLILSFVFLFACAGAGVKKPEKAVKGVYHRVKKGETLWMISRAYKTDILDLVVVNKITNPGAIDVDSVIFIPGADHVEEMQPVEEKHGVTGKTEPVPDKPREKSVKKIRKTPPAQTAAPATEAAPGDRTVPRVAEKTEQKSPTSDKSRFVWPIKGAVTTKFGVQPNGMKCNGIRISAREGTPVVASAAGEVTFAASIKYYGETIIIKHDVHYSTVYTSLKNKKVKIGDRVKKGEQIAHLGRSENGNGRPYLNFEIRQDHKPRNPLFFLP